MGFIRDTLSYNLLQVPFFHNSQQFSPNSLKTNKFFCPSFSTSFLRNGIGIPFSDIVYLDDFFLVYFLYLLNIVLSILTLTLLKLWVLVVAGEIRIELHIHKYSMYYLK